MPGFQFRLARVLEWYGRKCRTEEDRLVTCRALVRSTERKIERLQTERAAIDNEILCRPAIPATDFHSLGVYRLRAGADALYLAEEHRRLQVSADEQYARVQRARRRVRLLEKMKERRLEEYTSEAARELEALASDAYMARWCQAHRKT